MATDMFGNILSPEEEERQRRHAEAMGLLPPALRVQMTAPFGGGIGPQSYQGSFAIPPSVPDRLPLFSDDNYYSQNITPIPTDITVDPTTAGMAGVTQDYGPFSRSLGALANILAPAPSSSLPSYFDGPVVNEEMERVIAEEAATKVDDFARITSQDPVASLGGWIRDVTKPVELPDIVEKKQPYTSPMPKLLPEDLKPQTGFTQAGFTTDADVSVPGAEPDYAGAGMGDAGAGHPGMGMGGGYDLSGMSQEPYTGMESVFTGDEVDVASRNAPIGIFVRQPGLPIKGFKYEPYQTYQGLNKYALPHNKPSALHPLDPLVTAPTLGYGIPISTFLAQHTGEGPQPGTPYSGMGDAPNEFEIGHPGMRTTTPAPVAAQPAAPVAAPVAAPAQPAGPSPAEIARQNAVNAQMAQEAAARQRQQQQAVAAEQARQAQAAQAAADAQAQAALARQVYADLMSGRDRGEPSAREIERAMEKATQVDTFGRLGFMGSQVGIEDGGGYTGGDFSSGAGWE
jgi:pyruvate/2-oxoglutarate dehydrogenase complex dihydrolipoamide acyltransferase (E2) component